MAGSGNAVITDEQAFSNWGDFRQFVHSHTPQTIVLLAAAVLMLCYIGIQNVPTWDDSWKRLMGASGWGVGNGRWGGEWVSLALNNGRPLIDLGLTTFIVAGLAIGLAALVVVWTLVGSRANWFTFLAALAFALNPWIIHALGFRFDGPLMAISVLTAVFSIFFYGQPLKWVFLAYFIFTFITANFYQQTIGVILVLLMTKVLLDWLVGNSTTARALQIIGAGFAGIAAGMVIHFVQLSSLQTGRSDIAFDPNNIFYAFGENLHRFLVVFVTEQAASWLLFGALIVGLALVVFLGESIRGTFMTTAALVIYFVLAILASGGVLLLSTNWHIAVHARFRFPLALWIAMLAIIASSMLNNFHFSSFWAYRGLAWLTRIVLVAFSYLWLMVLFLFANAQGEQQRTLEFQSSMIFGDVMAIYRPGDTIIYDPAIFHNSIYWERVRQRFPIFEQDSYVAPLNLHIDNVRDRIIEAVGLPLNALDATGDRQGSCNIPSEVTRGGARWLVWRLNDTEICVSFPKQVKSEINRSDAQVFTVDLHTFPFNPVLVPDFRTLNPDDFKVAIWSRAYPEDIQWVAPQSFYDGSAKFILSGPPAGWQGDQLVAQFFLNDELLFQEFWLIGN